MIKQAISAIAATGALLVIPMTANAEFILLGSIDGNDCSGVFGKAPDCIATYRDPDTGDLLLAPTPLIAKFDWVDKDPEGNELEVGYWDVPELGKFASINGSEFTLDYAKGTWTYNPGEDDPVITAYVIKQANAFDLYGGTGTSGSWAPGKISHLSIYDGGSNGGGGGGGDLPEPGVLFLMGAGLLGLGMARRRKSV